MSNVETKEWRSFDLPHTLEFSTSTYYPQFCQSIRTKNLLKQQLKLVSFEEKGSNHHVLIAKVKRLTETWYHTDIVQMQIRVVSRDGTYVNRDRGAGRYHSVLELIAWLEWSTLPQMEQVFR
jgi:hypothetical protein